MEDKQTRRWNFLNYGLITVALTHTLTHSFQNIHTALAPTVKAEFGLSLMQIGIISAVPNLCQVVLSIPSGLLSDRIGSKKMLLIAMSVAALGAITAAATANWVMFTIAVSLLYMNTTIYHPASYSFVSKSYPPKERSKALGIQGAGGTLGMAIGPISIFVLKGVLGLAWRQIYLFWFFPLLVGIVLILRIKEEPSEDVEMTREEMADQGQATKLLTKNLLLFLVHNGFKMVASGMTVTFLSLFLLTQGWAEEYSALIIGGSSLMGIVAAPLGGFLAGRYGDKRWSLTMLLVSYACFAVAFMLGGFLPFTLFYLGHGFFNFMSMASNSSIMSKLSPSEQRGVGFSLYFLPGSIMGAVAPILGALIAVNFGMYYVFVASTVVYIAALFILKFGVDVK